MADYIRMDTQQLETLSTQMRSLSSSLQWVRRMLSGLSIDQTCGAAVKVDLSSFRLKTAQYKMSADTVSDSISCLCGALGALKDSTSTLSERIACAADTFYDAEIEFVWRFGGLSEGAASGFAQACSHIGLLPNRSEWTPEMIRNFEHRIISGDLATFGDLVFVRDGNMERIYGADGLLIQHEESKAFTKEKYSDRITLPDGRSFASEFEYGVQTLGIKGDNISLIEPEKISVVYGNSEEESVLPSGTPLELLTFGATGGMSVSALHGEREFISEHGSASVEADLLKAGFDYSAQGGFGVYLPDENGNPQLYLGGAGKIGASVCVAEASAEGEYELIDNVSLVGEVNVSVIEAEATAEAGLGIVGGEFVAYAKAGAEADLVKLEGKAGLDVAGIKGEIGGSVKVGIGASANIGYSDNKFSFELSAAAGVGADVSFEVDVSGFVDNAHAVFGKAVESASVVADWVKDGVSILIN